MRDTGFCLVISLALHAIFVAMIVGLFAPRPAMLAPALPSEVELGFVDGAPGRGGPSAGAPAAPKDAPPTEEAAKPPPPVAVAVNVAVPSRKTVPQEATPPVDDRPTDGAPGAGAGASPFGAGFSPGSGGGGLGVAGTGTHGTMIALQADLDRIRASALVLEAGALLDMIPGWRDLLAGSGLDPIEHFRRVLVATPDLSYDRLVVSARVLGGTGAVREAAARVAPAGGVAPPVWEPVDGLQVAPWRPQNATPRVVALLGADQLAIVPRDDLARLLAVAAGLGERNAAQPDMDRARGGAALLAMAEGEAVALSIEGARAFVVGATPAVPIALRLSVRDLDEFHTELRATALYEGAPEAERALAHADWLRSAWAAHPRAAYLGLQSALDEAEFVQKEDHVELRVNLTLHQIRYLLAFVAQALRPQGSSGSRSAGSRTP